MSNVREFIERHFLHFNSREVLVTDVMDAEPVHLAEFPEPSIWPFLASLATAGLLVSVVFTPWGLVWFAAPLFVTLTGWFWPKERAADAVTEPLAPGDPDPIVPEAPA